MPGEENQGGQGQGGGAGSGGQQGTQGQGTQQQGAGSQGAGQQGTGQQGTGTILTGERGTASGQAGTGTANVGPVSPKWLSDPRIPKEFQTIKSLGNIKGETVDEALPVLLKSHVEAQNYIGGSVRIPKPTDPPEKWDEFYNKTGRPAKPEDYQINMPDTGDMALSGEHTNSFLKTMHKVGASNKMVQAALDWYGTYVNETSNAYKTNQGNALEALKKEWGPSFVRNSVLAQRAAKEFFGPKVMAFLDKSGFGNDPEMIRAMAAMGERLAEDGTISGQITGVLTPADAQKKIAAILNDPTNPYHPKFEGTEAHKQAVKEMQDLYQIAYPPAKK